MAAPSVAEIIVVLLLLPQFRVLAVDPFSAALLGLKADILDGSSALFDWTQGSKQNRGSEVEACGWSRITCNQDSSKILSLDLSQKNLHGVLSGKYIAVLVDLIDLNISNNVFSGPLPAEVFNLTLLKSLDISRNNFSGPFPDGITAAKDLAVLDAFSNSFSGPLPVGVARLSSLKVLNLAGSYFQGHIPREYGRFKSLEFLHLAGNLLDGEIPPELGDVQTLMHMEMGYNDYHGSIPSQLGNLSSLQYLDIAQANLSGSIPALLSNLTRLESLFLFRNLLQGPVPVSFGNLKSLVDLDLSDNLLTGSIPTSFSHLTNLRLLSLMYNSMNGSVPEEIAELPALETLLIWNNFFSGPLPQNLGKNSQLKCIDVSTNGFTGTVPPRICSGGKLSKLMLFSNHFSDGLSLALSNCSSLIRLRVEDNSFVDPFPLGFNTLPNIRYADLSRNKFTGGISSEISQAQNLQYLNVSNNPNLGESLPAGIWSMPLIRNFSASSCNLSGNLPQFESCNSISVIELNKNDLSGAIPEHLSNCKALERLDLSDNKLTGTIPPGITNLPSIKIIDLSHNKLSGQIPSNFGNSSRLELLNVSFNDFSGSIPSKEILVQMGASAFSGNPDLCGAPLQPCLKTNPHVAGFRAGNRISEKLALVLGICSTSVLLAVVAAAFLYRRNQVQWQVIPFYGLPRFKSKDILKSLSYNNSIEIGTPQSQSLCKAVLPTGITVAVRQIEWEEKRRAEVLEVVNQLGTARHRNVVRLLGFCSSNCRGYLLYDYLPNGNLSDRMRTKAESGINSWAAKYKVVEGIARGLCYLHHDRYPPMPHGNLTANNVVFDENMEPHLIDFGLKYLVQMDGGWLARKLSKASTGERETAIKEEICKDVCSYGELLVEILSNGRLKKGGAYLRSKHIDTISREMSQENGCTDAQKEEINLVLQVSLLCTRSSPLERPSMEEILRLFSRLLPR